MKTLLIDNYDSYTHILGDYIWKITGQKPIILKNDVFSVDDMRKWGIQAIVISPGPGRPENHRDFGVCTEVLHAFKNVPTLGICLGHQGLGLFGGGKIVQAPVIKHGKHSIVKHEGSFLFKDVPQDIRVMRYHSLVMDESYRKEKLEVLARSKEDNQIMAIRHRYYPYFGLQFHPESIGTEYGELILGNFFSYASSWNLESRIKKSTPVTHDISYQKVDWIKPELVFEKLFRDKKNCFWLDSNSFEKESRYSVMGKADLTYEFGDEWVVIKNACTGKPVNKQKINDPYQWIRYHLNKFHLPQKKIPFPFVSGLIGYFSYEFSMLESIKNHSDSPYPNAVLFQSKQHLVFDHESKCIYIVNMHKIDSSSEFMGLQEKISSLSEQEDIDEVLYESKRNEKDHYSKKEYLNLILEAKKYILAGESYEVCLTNEKTFETDQSSFELYKNLRKINPASYSCYFSFDWGAILSASPEQFLSLDAEGHVVSEPIKGTRSKGVDENNHIKERKSLIEGPKEACELNMITDLIRNDLAKVCKPGSVQVSAIKKITELATIYQLSSVIEGKLRTNCDAMDLLQACFPGGSIIGAPKKRTMEIISKLEKRKRGIYTGSLGYIGYDGTIELNIAIRTMVKMGKQVVVGAGGAIIADSNPEKEYEEVCLKWDAMKKNNLTLFGPSEK